MDCRKSHPFVFVEDLISKPYIDREPVLPDSFHSSGKGFPLDVGSKLWGFSLI